MAVCAMMSGPKSGVGIPQDISIIGIDNTELGAIQVPGPISVRLPIVRLEGKEFVANQALGFEMVACDSTGINSLALGEMETTWYPTEGIFPPFELFKSTNGRTQDDWAEL
ncbi:MAG: hypothetical protein ABIU58_00945 [Ramlibacter sp.]